LDVEVRTSDGAVWPGEIALISADVVGISYPQGEGPPADSSERVTLAFRTPKGGALAARGRLVESEQGPGGERRLLFCFDEAVRPASKSKISTRSRTEALDDESNRRDAFRVPTDDDGGLEVTLTPFGDPSQSVLRQLTDLRLHGSQRAVRGWLIDISLYGLGVLVRDEADFAFEIGDHIDTSFSLPGREGPILLAGTVRHRVVVRLGTRYGVEFDQEPREHFEALQGDILTFVMHQQRHQLRHRAG